MSDIENIKKVKDKLEAIAGSNFAIYLSKLRQYCFKKISKEDFDVEIRKFLSIQAIHHHNELMNLVRDLSFSSLQTHSPTDFFLENIFVDKKSKKMKFQHHNIPENSFNPVSVSSYLPLAITPKSESEIPCCVTQLCLPDKSALHALMYAIAWEKGIDMVDRQAIEMIAYAVRFQIKAIVMAVLSRRSACKIREGKFKYAMGSPAINIYLQNAQKLKNASYQSSHSGLEKEGDDHSSHARPSVAWAESMAATEFACCDKNNKEKLPVSPWDLYEALQLYRNVIPSHDVYSRAMEEISAALYHPSNDELEQALLRKLQEKYGGFT